MALTKLGKLAVAGVVIGLLLIIFGIVIDHMPGIMMKKSVPIGQSFCVRVFPSICTYVINHMPGSIHACVRA